jgi:2-oxoglutarate/2-oxoacid ferredoxin oxidoreductase subunit beta
MTGRSPKYYRGPHKASWCKGCSYYSVLHALTEVFAARRIAPHRLSVVSGIGCSSRLPLFLRTFGLHTLHGRALPFAIGCRLAQPDIPVVVVAGDGDLFSIGISHFVHAARRNIDCTVICLDNRMYAMTKNQASPTSPKGYDGTLTPYGKSSFPLNVLEFAISCNATFVARTTTGSPEHMRNVIGRAFDHHGFSFVHVVAPCRTFSGAEALALLPSRCVDSNRSGHHDPADRRAALLAAADSLDFDHAENGRIPVGIFRETVMPTFEEHIERLKSPQKKRRSFSSMVSDFEV